MCTEELVMDTALHNHQQGNSSLKAKKNKKLQSLLHPTIQVISINVQKEAPFLPRLDPPPPISPMDQPHRTLSLWFLSDHHPPHITPHSLCFAEKKVNQVQSKSSE